MVGIEQLVLETKKYKEEKEDNLYQKNIKLIVKHYENIFCKKVEKEYGKGFKEKAKNVLPELVNYYFENKLKDNIGSFLSKKSKTIFFIKTNFDEIIYGENSTFIKLHYEDKLYKELCKKCNTKVLSNNQLKDLSASLIKNFYDNYLKNNKRSVVSNYFNVLINKKIDFYQNEEKMLLDYVIRVGVTQRIKGYFYSKYMHVFNEFNTLSLEDYKSVVDNVLNNYKSLHSDFEQNIRNGLKAKKDEEKVNRLITLKEIQAGNYENVDKVKKGYSYIIDLVFNNFKDKVVISEDILKQELTVKYDDYFNVAITSIKKGNNISLSRYINTRLSDHIRKKKSYFNIVYVDAEEKEKNKKDNKKLVYKYATKYADACPYDRMLNILTKYYYYSVEEYYMKERKVSFDTFIKGKLRDEAKLLNIIYKDDSKSELTKTQNNK